MRVFQVTLTSIVFGKDDPSGWPKDKVLEYLIDNPGMIGSIQSVRMAPQGAVVDEKPVSSTSRVAAKKERPPIRIAPGVRAPSVTTSNGSLVWFGPRDSHLFYDAATNERYESSKKYRVRKKTGEFEFRYTSHDYLGEAKKRGFGSFGKYGNRKCVWLTRPQSSMTRERIENRTGHDMTRHTLTLHSDFNTMSLGSGPVAK